MKCKTNIPADANIGRGHFLFRNRTAPSVAARISSMSKLRGGSGKPEPWGNFSEAYNHARGKRMGDTTPNFGRISFLTKPLSEKTLSNRKPTQANPIVKTVNAASPPSRLCGCTWRSSFNLARSLDSAAKSQNDPKGD